MIPTLLFYLFATLTVVSALAVISAKNPVHAVLFLIFCFFNAAGLFVLIGAEYLAMTLVIVYVGAVAVLFLFVVMMLDVNFTALREGFLRYLPLGLGVAAMIFVEICLMIYWTFARNMAPESLPMEEAQGELTNTVALGRILYTDYIYAFQIAGLILLVAMIGAIVLTLRHRPGVRRQSVGAQMARKVEDCIEIVKVKSGEGA